MKSIGDCITEGGRKVLLVDGNNALARNGHVFHGLEAKDGRPTGAIYGAVKEVRKLVAEFNCTSAIFCLDSGVPTFRKQLVEKHAAARPDGQPNGYKEQRSRQRSAKQEETRDAWQAQLDYCHEVFNPLGVHVASAAGFEGDDLIGSIAQSFKKKRFLVCSSDKDLLQLTRLSRVEVYSPTIHELVEDRVPRCYTLMRAIEGDSSDNIPGVPGVGEAMVASVFKEADLMECGKPSEAVAKIIEWLDSEPDVPKRIITAANKIVDERKRFMDYWKAISLVRTKGCHEQATVHYGAFDKDEAYQVCKAYDFREFRQEWDVMQRTFGNLGA